MKRKSLFSMIIFLALSLVYSVSTAQPKGAKALFDSGEGTRVGIVTGKATNQQSPVISQPSPERYVGIKYEILLQRGDGSFQKVPKARVFNTGDRIRIQVRTNQSGYLTIRNIGTSGNTNILFSEYVEAKQLVEIPKTGSIRFVGAPGTEIVEILLSADPIYQNQGVIASNPPTTHVPPPSSTYTSSAPPPPPSYGSSAPPPPPTYSSGDPLNLPPPPSTSSDIANLPPPPPQALAYNNISSGKGVRGSKDLVLTDSMNSNITVVDRRTWKPTQTGVKDLIVESQGGSNYGVVPVSTLQDGRVLITEIKLKHK